MNPLIAKGGYNEGRIARSGRDLSFLAPAARAEMDEAKRIVGRIVTESLRNIAPEGRLMGALNTVLLARARRAPSQAAKLAALVALVTEVLRLHAAGFIVADAIEDAVESDSRRERLALMATDGRSQSAVRYAEVAYQGDRGSPNPDSPDAAHEYLVAVYWGVPRAGFNAASEAAFRAALESTDPATPGLLWAIRAQDYLQTDEGTVRDDGRHAAERRGARARRRRRAIRSGLDDDLA